jgi:pyruvate formate lyase activating enzyme
MLQEAKRKEALLYESLDHKKVHCYLCAHHCKIVPEKFGFCNVRENKEGKLYTHAYGNIVARNNDPIEKKPLFHLLPGSRSYSIAAIGCNFRCAFCQNWQISQSAEAALQNIPSVYVAPEAIVNAAVAANAQSISFTYTEPTIFFEYALDISQRARQQGLRTVFVTNGYMTEEALRMIQPYLDAANVDLKFYDDKKYRRICSGTLQPVLDTIRRMREHNIWVEVTTLVIPGENDSAEELRNIARFIAQTGKEIPWHISAFHPDYHFMDHEATAMDSLDRSYMIGKEAGLWYVYKGNVAEESNTFCHNCNELLIERQWFNVLNNRLTDTNKCPKCGKQLEGMF